MRSPFGKVDCRADAVPGRHAARSRKQARAFRMKAMQAYGCTIVMHEIQNIDSDQPRRRTGGSTDGFQPVGLIVRRFVADLISQRVAAANEGWAAAEALQAAPAKTFDDALCGIEWAIEEASAADAEIAHALSDALRVLRNAKVAAQN